MGKPIYELLRDYRKMLKIKQKDVAKATGLSCQQLSMKERGLIPMTLENAVRIADYLGLKITVSFNLSDRDHD